MVTFQVNNSTGAGELTDLRRKRMRTFRLGLLAAVGLLLMFAGEAWGQAVYTPPAGPNTIANPVKGVYIPTGSLNIWRTARNNAASALCEVAIIGDSTTFGISGGFYNYPWPSKLRRLSVAAGFADGGRGWFNGAAYNNALYESEFSATIITPPAQTLLTSLVNAGANIVIPVSSTTGFAVGNLITIQDNGGGNFEYTTISAIGTNTITATIVNNHASLAALVKSAYSSAPTGWAVGTQYSLSTTYVSRTLNDTITIPFASPNARLWSMNFSQGGAFSYAVNGGAATTVTQGSVSSMVSSGNDSAWSPTWINVAGLTGGGATNTITIKNLGGNQAVPPDFVGQGGVVNSGGSLTASTTYYYVVTRTVNGGETAGSAEKAWTTTGTNKTVSSNVRFLGTSSRSGGTFNAYRSTVSGGPYSLLFTGLINIGNNTVITDDGTTTPNAAIHPPASTGGLMDNTYNEVSFNIDAYNSTGIVYYNHGLPGASSTGWFGVNNSNQNFAPLLGLAPNGTNASERLIPSVVTGARHPALVMEVLGINDVQYSNLAIAAVTTGEYCNNIRDAIGMFVRLTRNAGADALIIIPPLEDCNYSRQMASSVRAAIMSAAQAYNCAVCDLGEALGPFATWSGKGYGIGPHLTPTAYDAEANYLWTNCLNQ